MRPILSVLVMASLAALAAADGPDDRERRAKAAVALAGTVPLATAAGCKCPDGTAGPWPDQLDKAMREHKVIVLFSAGATPRCCQGCLVGVADQVQPGMTKEKPIVVYRPLGPNRLQIVAELPADASAAQIRAAVKKAQDLHAAKPK